MTDTEKIINKTKEYILKLYSQGYSNHQFMVAGLKNGIDFFVGRKDRFNTIKGEILITCLTEFEQQTKGYNNIGHLKMVNTIRTQFINFVSDLNVNELSETSTLSFERRLKEEESKRIENDLKNKFDFGSWKDVNHYWEPLCETQNNTQTIYFDIDLFKTEYVQVIVDILKSISGDKIYLITDVDINYEIETSSLSFHDPRESISCELESAYCDHETDWLIYISHESTITFSGEKLITRIENELTEIIKFKNP